MLNYFPAIDIVLFFITLKLCNKIFENLYGVFAMKKLSLATAVLASVFTMILFIYLILLIKFKNFDLLKLRRYCVYWCF